MKNPLSILLFILSLFFVGCSKTPTNATSIEVVVKNNKGELQSNKTIYQMNSSQYNLYGAVVFFSEKQVASDSKGIAKFIINDSEFDFSAQKTYYYFYDDGFGNFDKTKHLGITVSINDKKSGEIVID